MTDPSKNWVICFNSFDPGGVFISEVDFEHRVPIKAKAGLNKAERFHKAEIPYILEQLADHVDTSRLLPVNLGDHFF